MQRQKRKPQGGKQLISDRTLHLAMQNFDPEHGVVPGPFGPKEALSTLVFIIVPGEV
jgi:hypothetical protein